jgi:broad specificity polyphosphatase/5'/3'-nucleotidase SurE
MKFFRLYLIFSAAIMFLIFPSCSDDTTTTPTDPPSNVLYTWDTLAAIREAGTTGSVNISQSFAKTISATQVKVEYRLQSNVDTTLGCWGSYKDSTNGTGVPSPVNYNINAPVDSAFSYIWNVSTQPYYSGFGVNLVVTVPQGEKRYVRLVNIKVTKVQ